MERRSTLPPPPPAKDGEQHSPQQEALWRLVLRCEQAATGTTDPKLAARLAYATGRVCEELLDATGRAEERYLEAFGRDPDYAPNLRASRRLKAAMGDWPAVLALIDAELRQAETSPEAQAELYLERGTILERQQQDLSGAREAYACAMELDESSPLVWLRLSGVLARTKAWLELDDLLERVLGLAKDPALKAALLARRAALAAERLESPERAIALDEEALTLKGDLPMAIVSLKRLYRDGSRWTELIELHERELKLLDGPAKIHCYYQLARLYARRFGRADLAIEFLEKAQRIEPDDVLVLTVLGELYEQAARFTEQVLVDEHLLGLSKDQIEQLALHHRIGLTCEEQLGDDDRAIMHYRAAVELRPSYTPAMQALGRLYRKHDRLEELLEMHKIEAKQASEADRGALAHYRAAEMLENQLGRVDEAVEQYEEAVRWVPSFLPAQQALRRLYERLERWEELVAFFEHEAESLRGGSLAQGRQDPLRVARLEQVGRLWEDSIGNLDEAAKTYSRILELDPGHVGALYALERIYEKAERWSELIEVLERQVELVEDEGWATAILHQIGEIAEERLEDRTLAVVYYRRALTIRPSYVPTLTALGRIYIEQGRFTDLLAIHRKEAEVTELPERRAAIHFRIGDIHEHRLSDLEQAEGSYRKALELDPELWPALRALERLLRRRRRWQDLAEVLEGQAAGLDTSTHRAVAFYRVGELWEDRLGQTESAWDAYHQSLAADPAFYPSRVALDRLARRRGHLTQLAEILGDQLSTIGDGFAALEVLSELAALWRHDLDASGQACEAYGEMSALAPGDLSALLAQLELHWGEGCGDEIGEVCRRLIDASDDPLVKVAALRELASLIEEGDGEPAEAKEVWAEVLSLRPLDVAARFALGAVVGASESEVVRPEVAASVQLVRALALFDEERVYKAIEAIAAVYGADRDWLGLAGAYDKILTGLEGEAEGLGPARALVLAAQARLKAEHLGDTDEAERQLRAVLEERPDDIETRAALAELLGRDEARRDEAIVEHQHILTLSPCRMPSVQALELLWREADELGQAQLALGVLSCFRAVSADEEVAYQTRRPALGEEQGDPIDREVLLHHVLAQEPRPTPEAVALLEALLPLLDQVYPPDLGAFGLTREDRIPSAERHPLRQRAERVGWLLGFSSFDLYLHQVPSRGEGLELTEPPSLVLPHQVEQLPVSHQVFLLATLLAEVVLGTWVARKLSPFELERLLTAATRLHVESFRRGDGAEAADSLRRKLERTLSDQDQASLLEPARAFAAAAPTIDYDRWSRQMVRLSRRVGLLACGDIEAALSVLTRDDERLSQMPKGNTEEMVAAFACNEVADDLVGWYLSEDHAALRRLAGLDRRSEG